MKFLSDYPQKTQEFLPPGSRWQPAGLTDFNKTDHLLWQALGRGGQVQVCDVADPAGFVSTDPRIVLISHAPESQFMAATRILRQGISLPDSVFCLALEGKGFRGQRNRTWEALAGNLHLTVVYQADIPARNAGAELTMLPAVAAAETTRTALEGQVPEGQVPVTIKWINDILIDGQKAAGVLTSTQIRGDRITGVVFGVGINVAQAPCIDPTPFAPSATAISRHAPSRAHQLPDIFRDIAVRIDRYYRNLQTGGPSTLFGRYRKYTDIVGHRVCIWPENISDWKKSEPFASGTVTELKPDLSLILDHHPEPITKGRLAYESA